MPEQQTSRVVVAVDDEGGLMLGATERVKTAIRGETLHRHTVICTPLRIIELNMKSLVPDA